MLREPKNTGMADKKTASSIRKTQKIPDKNRDDGGKTRQEPAQDRQKKNAPGTEKYRICWKIPLQRKQPDGKSIPKNVNFPSGKFWEKWKNYGYGEKNFPHCTEKAWKWFERWGKNARKREAEAEKNRLFLRKEFRKSTENTGMGWKNFSALDKKYPDEAKKSRKRMIRMKEQQSFFCRQTTEKCRKRSRKKPKNLSSLSPKGMKNIRPHKDKSCHLRTIRSPKTALSIGNTQGKKQKSSRSG